MRALGIALCSLAGLAAQPPTVLSDLNVKIPMRDGVRLAAHIAYPTQPTRLPTILVRTPYGKGAAVAPQYLAFTRHGYAVVVQDVRGRYDSEGVFDPLNQEGPDGDDTLTWIARQPWSDGKVGMTGGSYVGIVQWKAALRNNPALKAIFPVVSGWDDYIDRFYSTGGALKLGQRLMWLAENLRAPGFRPPPFDEYVRALPLRTADIAATGHKLDLYQQALDHPTYDGFWKERSTRARIGRIRVPVFSVGGWFDNFGQSDLEAHVALRKSSDTHRILIGPWPHNMSTPFPGIDFGKHAAVPVQRLQLEWFDRWLKGKPAPPFERPVRIFVMGTNAWRDERQWPPETVRYEALYLRSKGRANSLDGDGALSFDQPGRRWREPDHFTYDPKHPTPTRGGAVCCNPRMFPWGPLDQREVERRQDVLVYSTDALKEDLEVTGPIQVVLYVSTSAPDTDFTAKLVDVFPEGEARLLTDGILRLRYRNSLEKPEPASPGVEYRIAIDAGVTSNVFLKGHRIRLEVSSSNFPRFDRNPNTGRPIANEREMRAAQQTVFHDPERLSHIVLPVNRIQPTR